jgi:uncharacterized protein YutE (UPF0331/DUF86 family)
LPIDFSKKIDSLAGFRSILVHEYIGIDWDEVYRNLQGLSDLKEFAEYVKGLDEEQDLRKGKN